MKNSVLIAAGGLVAIALALSVSGYVVADAPPPDIAEFEQQKMYERSVGQSTPDQDDIRMRALIENEGVVGNTNNADIVVESAIAEPKKTSNTVRGIQNEHTLIPGTNAHAVVMYTYGYPDYYHLVINPDIQAEVGDYIHWYDYGIWNIGADRRLDFSASFDRNEFMVMYDSNGESFYPMYENKNITALEPSFITHLVIPGEYEWKWYDINTDYGSPERDYNTIRGTITVTYPEPEPIPITNQTG